MNATRIFLRQSSLVSTKRVAVAARPVNQHADSRRSRKSVHANLRCFSAQPEKAVCYEDLVKETLRKMIAEKDEPLTKTIADEELQLRFQHYENVFKEAELCIADLQEATPDEREEEFSCASGAVDTAFQAYLDLLEDLRMASEEQLKNYQDVRNENASNLKRLRKELSTIKGDNA